MRILLLLCTTLWAVESQAPPSPPHPPIFPIELGAYLTSGRCPVDLTEWQCGQAALSAGKASSFLYDEAGSTVYAGHACLHAFGTFYYNRAASAAECGPPMDCVCFVAPSPPPVPPEPTPASPPALPTLVLEPSNSTIGDPPPPPSSPRSLLGPTLFFILCGIMASCLFCAWLGTLGRQDRSTECQIPLQTQAGTQRPSLNITT